MNIFSNMSRCGFGVQDTVVVQNIYIYYDNDNNNDDNIKNPEWVWPPLI